MRSSPTILLSLLTGSLCLGSLGHTQVAAVPAPALHPAFLSVQPQNRRIAQATLLSPTEGYVTAGDRIFYTTTLGSSWTDITPKEARGSLLTDTFPSSDEGLAYLSTATVLDLPATIQVFKTLNKGASWSLLSSISAGEALKNFGGLTDSSFFDSRHGWLAVRQSSGSAFSWADLFSTVDGGGSWQLLTSLPVFGQLTFISPSVGFLLGGFDDSELYRTSDAGRTWAEVKFPGEAASKREAQISLSLPRFESESNGSLIFQVLKGGGILTAATYATKDGGATWSKVATRSLAATAAFRVGTDTNDPIVVQAHSGSHVYTSHVSETANVFALSTSFKNALVSQASFMGDQIGWIVVSSDLCTAPKTGCTESDTLMLTKDGGVSYTDVTPVGIPLSTEFHNSAQPLPDQVEAVQQSRTSRQVSGQ